VCLDADLRSAAYLQDCRWKLQAIMASNIPTLYEWLGEHDVGVQRHGFRTFPYQAMKQ
jgi:hypothetical protein